MSFRSFVNFAVGASLVLAIMRTESNFNPFAVSGAPAYGLMQLVPTSGGRAALKRAHGIDATPTDAYLFDPDHSIELGAAYLSILTNEEFRPVVDAQARDYCVIAAYNTGPRNVTRTFAHDRKAALSEINHLQADAIYDRLRTNLPYGETCEYVVKVTGYRRQFVSLTAPVTAMQ